MGKWKNLVSIYGSVPGGHSITGIPGASSKDSPGHWTPSGDLWVKKDSNKHLARHLNYPNVVGIPVCGLATVAICRTLVLR